MGDTLWLEGGGGSKATGLGGAANICRLQPLKMEGSLTYKPVTGRRVSHWQSCFQSVGLGGVSFELLSLKPNPKQI